MSISLRLRIRVFERDGFTCQYCGAKAPAVVLQVDHVHPRSLGGSDHYTNLVTACFDCNMGKKAAQIAPPNWDERDKTLLPLPRPSVVKRVVEKVKRRIIRELPRCAGCNGFMHPAGDDDDYTRTCRECRREFHVEDCWYAHRAESDCGYTDRESKREKDVPRYYCVSCDYEMGDDHWRCAECEEPVCGDCMQYCGDEPYCGDHAVAV